jgi:hypothetical protein
MGVDGKIYYSKFDSTSWDIWWWSDPVEKTLADKLSSPTAEAIYKRRQTLVEPVFGNIKFNLGFNRFCLRGLEKVRIEFLLMCIAHNLKKTASQ